MVSRGIDGVGVAAVVSGDDDQVGILKRSEKRAEERVEFLKRAGEAFHVFAMAVEHVEIDEIREDEPARLARERFGELGYAVGIIFCGDVIGDATPVVDVVNFADAENGNFCVGEHIEKHGARRLDGIIVAALGATIIPWRAGERTSDDATNTMRSLKKLARDFAHFVELGDGNRFFMRGDLENAVAGGVNDRKAGTLVLFAEFLDDFGAGGGLVAESFAADRALEFFHEIAREAVLVNGEGLIEPDTGHFPVAGSGVFAGRNGNSLPESTDGMRGRIEMRERLDIGEAEANEIRKSQWTRAGDVAERVTANVTVIGSVRKLADADAIEDDPDDAREYSLR